MLVVYASSSTLSVASLVRAGAFRTDPANSSHQWTVHGGWGGGGGGGAGGGGGVDRVRQVPARNRTCSPIMIPKFALFNGRFSPSMIPMFELFIGTFSPIMIPMFELFNGIFSPSMIPMFELFNGRFSPIIIPMFELLIETFSPIMIPMFEHSHPRNERRMNVYFVQYMQGSNLHISWRPMANRLQIVLPYGA